MVCAQHRGLETHLFYSYAHINISTSVRWSRCERKKLSNIGHRRESVLCFKWKVIVALDLWSVFLSHMYLYLDVWPIVTKQTAQCAFWHTLIHTQRMSSAFLEKSWFMLIVVDVCNESGVVSVEVYNGECDGYALFRSASAFLETQLPGWLSSNYSSLSSLR